MKQTPTYNSWRGMKQRCLNPNHEHYSRYGGRGITVCKAWLKFENFLEDMGERPLGKTLERKDNDKGYSKANCCWATRRVQRLNQQPHNRQRELCKRGHPLRGTNLYVSPEGQRKCITCQKEKYHASKDHKG